MTTEDFKNILEVVFWITLGCSGGVAACVLGVLYLQNKEG
jgi:hypothetical protein